jgi:hypothetical protein
MMCNCEMSEVGRYSLDVFEHSPNTVTRTLAIDVAYARPD